MKSTKLLEKNCDDHFLFSSANIATKKTNARMYKCRKIKTGNLRPPKKGKARSVI